MILKIVKKNTFEGQCNLCRATFSVKFDGRSAVLTHSRSAKHKASIRLQQQNSIISSFLRKSHTKEDDLITAAELTSVYNNVKHDHSYNSLDCSNKLSEINFSDSSIAKKLSCDHTKSSCLVENILAPAAQEQLLSKLES